MAGAALSAADEKLAMMPWFPKDWIIATRHFTLAQRGAYADLLFFQWEMGRLPTDREALLRLLQCSASEYEHVWSLVGPKFVVEGSAMYNERLEAHRSKSKQLKSQKAFAGQQGGIKSGEARRSKREAEAQAQAQAEVKQPASVSLEANGKSPSPSPSILRKDIREEGEKRDPPPSNGHGAPLQNGHAREPWEDEGDRRFAQPAGTVALNAEVERKRQWNLCRADYPEVGGRVDWAGAEHHASKLVSDGLVTWPELYAAVIRYKLYVQATAPFVMNPKKFFHAEDKPWSMPWAIPEERTRVKPQARVAKTADQLEAEERENAKH